MYSCSVRVLPIEEYATTTVVVLASLYYIVMFILYSGGVYFQKSLDKEISVNNSWGDLSKHGKSVFLHACLLPLMVATNKLTIACSYHSSANQKLLTTM